MNDRDYFVSSLSLLLQTPFSLIIVAESQPNFARCAVDRTESLKIKIRLRINAMRIGLFTQIFIMKHSIANEAKEHASVHVENKCCSCMACSSMCIVSLFFHVIIYGM